MLRYQYLYYFSSPKSEKTIELIRYRTIARKPDDRIRKPSVLLGHELVKAHIPEDKIIFALCRVGNRDNEIEEARSYIHNV